MTQPRDGYVTVYDDVCDRDPAMLRRLAKEISSRTGLVVITLGIEEEALVRMIIFDRGGIVDEYASVPEFHGPLPPGEVWRCTPTPSSSSATRARRRRRFARPLRSRASPADLPPARELLGGLAGVLGLSGAEHGWADAPEADAAHRIDR